MVAELITENALSDMGFTPGVCCGAWRIDLPSESVSGGEFVTGFVQLLNPTHGDEWTAEIHTETHAEGRKHRDAVCLPRTFSTLAEVVALLRVCGVSFYWREQAPV